MTLPDSVTQWIAAYGAVVATAGLILTLRRDWSDRPHLRVQAIVERRRSSVTGAAVIADVMHVKLVNNGRRDIEVAAVGVVRTNGERFALEQYVGNVAPAPIPLPRRLAPSESLVLRFAHFDRPLSVRAILALDSEGRAYRIRPSQLRDVQRGIVEAAGGSPRLTFIQWLRPHLPLWGRG